MGTDDQIQEMQDHIAFLKEKIQQISEDVIKVLGEDLPKFVEREIKKQFLEGGEFAMEMDGEMVKKLKGEIQKRGNDAAAAVIETLKPLELWLMGRDFFEDAKGLEANPQLWEKVNKISETVQQLLTEYSFPETDSRPDIAYKPPTWFIAGLYLPSLSEAYWKRIKELVEMENKVSAITRENARQTLGKRWDTF